MDAQDRYLNRNLVAEWTMHAVLWGGRRSAGVGRTDRETAAGGPGEADTWRQFELANPKHRRKHGMDRWDDSPPSACDRHAMPARRGAAAWVALLLAIGVCISFLTASGRRVWELSIFERPVKFTELYFLDASAMPINVVRGEAVQVRFEIVNHEEERKDYQYVISEQWERRSVKLRQAAAHLVNNGSGWQVAVPIRPSCTSHLCRIRVSLIGQPETIAFSVTLTSKRGMT